VEPALGLKDYARLGGAEKAGNVAIHQDWRTVFDALVVCLFANLDPMLLLSLVNAACGLDWELPDLLRCGERAFNLKRLINHRLGLLRTDDSLPAALRIPYPDEPEGVPAGFAPNFDVMLQAYYQARGWDPATGRPLPEKLESLGLGWAGETV
jgi:aldehyde:ferredoxin oxidoreductase